MDSNTALKSIKIPFNGKLNTTLDPIMIGTNFSQLKNLRYTDTHKEGVNGMTKININAPSTFVKFRNGFHFIKQHPTESHVLVQGYNGAETASKVLENTTAIPSTGDFSTTALWTDGSGAGHGLFSTAPVGQMAYTNGVEACIWGGNEFRTAQFVNYELAYTKSILLSSSGTPIAVTSSKHGFVTGRSVSITGHTVNTGANGIWKVTVSSSGAFTLDGSVATGVGGATGTIELINFAFDYTDRINNTSTGTGQIAQLITPALASYVAGSTNCWMYLGSTRPLAGFKPYMGQANTATNSSMNVKYWSGSSWTAVAALSDGTRTSSSITFSQTGSVSWTKPSDKIRELYGVFLYWYQIQLTKITGSPTVKYLTTNAPFQTIVDVPDGQDRKIASFQQFGYSNSPVYVDYTVNVFDDTFVSTNTATFADVSNLLTGYSDFLCGFTERAMGIKVHIIGGKENGTACTLTLSYSNGQTWIAATNVRDGTSINGASFGQSGIITWDPPTPGGVGTQEFPTGKENNDQLQLYYYKLAFSATFDASVQIYYVAGIPAQKSILGYSAVLHANNRLILLDELKGQRNKAIVSNTDAPDVWNGADYQEFFFGDEKKLTGGAFLYSQLASNIYNMMVFFKENETWVVRGSGPSDWVQHRVSDTIGCISPKTISVINLPVELQSNGNKQVVVFQGSNGVYIFDGSSILPIHQDIRSIFDKTIERTKIAKSVGFYDPSKEEYHWLFNDTTGSGSYLNKEFVFDMRHHGWFEIIRATDRIHCGFPVLDTNGNQYNYGGTGDGFLMRLENGKTFNGSAIDYTAWLGGIPLTGESIMHETKIKATKLIQVAKTVTVNNTSLDIYPDGSATPVNMTFSPVRTGYRIADVLKKPNVPVAIYYSLKFTMSTSDETIGFEPLQCAIWYQVIREDLT